MELHVLGNFAQNNVFVRNIYNKSVGHQINKLLYLCQLDKIKFKKKIILRPNAANSTEVKRLCSL